MSESRPPSILLVTVDTLRADHLGLYGYRRPTDVELRERLHRFTLFEAAYTPLPLTLPAHASVLTGRYPREIGVLNNHHGVPGGERAPAVLPEMLAAAGYHSAAVVGSSILSSVTGIARGFDRFDEPDRRRGERRRSADAVNEVAMSVAESVREPLFLWVHYYDVHSPFDLPDRFFCMLREDDLLRDEMKRRGLSDIEYHQVLNTVHTMPLRENGRRISLTEMIARYDASIRYATHRLTRLLDLWDGTPHGPGSLVIITSDHGEGLGEHGFWSHGGRLFDDTLRVPLLIRWPGSRGATPRQRAVLSLLDLTPTILAVAGVDVPRLLPGTDIRTVVGGGSRRQTEVVAQRMRYLSIRNRPSQRDWRPGDGWAVVNDRFKFVQSDDNGRALYDRGSDPHELVNLIDRKKKVSRRLAETLERWLAETRDARPELPQAESESERLKRLRSLGYVE